MSVSYPQASVQMVVLWRNRKKSELSIRPRHITVNLNNYSEANSFSLVADYKDFPFDPRAMRSCLVFIYMQDMGENRWGQWEIIDQKDENLILQGYIDVHMTSFSQSAREVSMEGRDMTALLIDQLRYVAKPVVVTGGLEQTFRKLLNEYKRKFGGFEIDTSLVADKSRLTNLRGHTHSQINQSRGDTYWDIIQDIVQKSGLIVYVNRLAITIADPQNFYETLEEVHCIYGVNLSSLTLERDLGLKKSFNVGVRTARTDRKRNNIIKVSIPKDAVSPDLVKNYGRRPILREFITPDGNVEVNEQNEAPTRHFFLRGLGTKSALISAGESIFRQMSLQEMTGNLTTREMKLPRQNLRYRDGKLEADRSSRRSIDFSKIKAGTTIKIVFSQEDMRRMDTFSKPDERRAYLLSRGYNPEVVGPLAEAYAEIAKKNFRFYVKAVSLSLGSDGFTMSVDFINLIDIGHIA